MSQPDPVWFDRRRRVAAPPIDEPLSPSQLDQQAGFYRAIQADLDADAPRLVYADWLDEQGGEARALRAEFIRLQCATPFRSLHMGHLFSDRAPQEQTREGEIFELFAEVWAKDLNLHSPRAVYEAEWAPRWRRGFPEKIMFAETPTCSNHPTGNGLPFLRDVSIQFDNECAGQVQALFDSGAFCNLRSLCLCCASGRHTPFSILMNVPDLPHLTSLEIFSATVSQTDLATILAAPLAATLTDFTVSMCEFGDVELRMLAASSVLRHLRTLKLSHSDITDEGAIALSRSQHLKGLTQLDLSSNRLTERGRAALRESARLRRDCEIIFDER